MGGKIYPIGIQNFEKSSVRRTDLDQKMKWFINW